MSAPHEWRKPNRSALDLNTRLDQKPDANYLAALRIVRGIGYYNVIFNALRSDFLDHAMIGMHRALRGAGRYDVFLCQVPGTMRPIKFVQDELLCADLLIGPFEDGLLPLWVHDWSDPTLISELPLLCEDDIDLLADAAATRGIETYWENWSAGKELWRQTSAKVATKIELEK